MTVKETENRLKKAGIENAAGEALLLWEHFSGIPRSRLIIMKNEDREIPSLEEALRRREAHEPLQYILGEWSFMKETYEVNPSTLVPREDTELLVSYAIENTVNGGKILDLCAGSGCVGISTLAARRDLSCVAVELYGETLETAKRNAKRNGVEDRISFIKADVTMPCLPKGELFDAVLSNPPYVTADEWETLADDVKKEPKAALTDGGDGLSIIRKIIEIYPSHLKEGGFVAIEMGASQGEAVSGIAEENGLSCRILKDYSGKDRVALCHVIK